MSAPLVVNTEDGMCWTLREATRDGQELYALEAVTDCPAHLMETYAELKEHGIVGSADVLPMPVGPKPQPLSAARLAEAEERGAHLYEFGGDSAADEWNRLAGDDVPVLVKEIRRQAAVIAELNESVSSAAEALRADAGQALPWAHAMPDGDLHGFLDDMVSAAMGRWRSGPEVPDRTVLADIERVCANWRTPGEGFRSDPESGPEAEESSAVGYPPALPWARVMDGEDLDEFLADLTASIVGHDGAAALAEIERTCATWRLIAEAQHGHNTAEGPDERPVDGLTATFMPVAAYREDPHDSPLHHDWRLGRDLPELGGA